MIRLGLRLTLAGGREAALRLVMIVVAVAVGVGLLLTTLASLNAVSTQNARYAWLETGATGSDAPALTGQAATDPLWWRLRVDYYQGREIGRVDVAATGPNSPIPPGIAALPGPGQFYASPALAKLLRDVPAPQLGDRYPGRLVGTIGDAALPAPNSLIIVVGRGVAELSHAAEARQVSRISTTAPNNCSDCIYGVGINDNGMTLILSIVIAALLLPVLVFIAGATRLSAARREQRFAAMRLVGATPGQISVLSAVESSIATVIGVVLGFGLFYAFRSPLAAIPFTGAPFFPHDLSPSPTQVLVVAFGLPVAAAVAARIALRRVSISPLGVSRRVTPRPPRGWRMIPLLAGLGELGYFAYVHDIGADTRTDTTTEAAAFLSGILLTMIGLVIAGPWLTMLGSRVLARRATRAAPLIAGRRLSDNPQAGFRAISGLVLAVFVGTCALAVISTIAADNGGTPRTSALATSTLVEEFRFGPEPEVKIGPDDTATLNRLAAVPGVTGLASIRFEPDSQPAPYFGPPPDYISCAELAKLPALGRCWPGAQTAIIAPDYGGAITDRTSMSERIWAPAPVSVAQLAGLPLATIVVGTDASVAAVEQARTVLDLTYPQTFGAQTLHEYQAFDSQRLNGYRQLANVVILVSLPIAGCSLAVNVAGGLAERRRPFGLLRLAGAPLAMLRRVVLLEAAAPLLVAAAVSAGAGLLAAHLFLRAQLSETLRPPGAQYYLLLTAGLIASLAVIASTLPLLGRITGPESVRND
ncbi:MAG: FtsX-like permease family protein [Jatrophihabitantaceae bacterium]